MRTDEYPPRELRPKLITDSATALASFFARTEPLAALKVLCSIPVIYVVCSCEAVRFYLWDKYDTKARQEKREARDDAREKKKPAVAMYGSSAI